MRHFFEPANGPLWLKQVLSSIRRALGDVWDTPIRPFQAATADLPTAADFTGGLAWNTTTLTVNWSDGSAWVAPSLSTHTHTFASLTSKPTTLAGYGITDGQPLDSTLTAFAAYNTNGLLTQTAADTFTGRTIAVPAAGLSISNADGVSGNPTLALANDLAALEALSGTNTIYYRSAADTWTAVTIGGILSFSAGTLDVGDAELTAIAGLASAADKVPYYTGSGTAALADFTQGARAITALSWSAGTQVPALTAAGTASLKTVGSAAGNILDKAAGDTLYQPLDSELTAIAGLTSAANKVPYFTGSGTAALTDFLAAAAVSSHTPTVSSGTGSYTNVPTATMSYIKIGLGVFFSTTTAASTNIGTAGGAQQLTLPTTAGDVGMALGEEFAIGPTNAMGKISAGSNLLRVTKLDGTTLIANNARIRVAGFYISAT